MSRTARVFARRREPVDFIGRRLGNQDCSLRASGTGCGGSFRRAARECRDCRTRGLTRQAFGSKIAHLGGNLQIIAQARCEIEAMRLMVLKAAKAMDVLGNKEARIWVSMVKAMVPERACKIIDQAIQMHGATGISQWTPLRRRPRRSSLDGGRPPRTEHAVGFLSVRPTWKAQTGKYIHAIRSCRSLPP